MALDIKEGDAVFVPSFTFYASAEVISFQKATPIFIDSDSRTFNIDVEKLEKAIKEVKKDGKLKPKAIDSRQPLLHTLFTFYIIT